VIWCRCCWWWGVSVCVCVFLSFVEGMGRAGCGGLRPPRGGGGGGWLPIYAAHPSIIDDDSKAIARQVRIFALPTLDSILSLSQTTQHIYICPYLHIYIYIYIYICTSSPSLPLSRTRRSWSRAYLHIYTYIHMHIYVHPPPPSLSHAPGAVGPVQGRPRRPKIARSGP
jgi:hypothetical protein